MGHAVRPLTFSLLLCAVVFGQTAVAQDVTDHGEAALSWINNFRAGNGRGPLTVSETLSQAAAMHAADMASKGYFSHSGSDGSNVGERVRRVGYGFCFVAEKVAKGQRGLEAVLKGWAGSSAHRENMLASQAHDVALVEAPGRIWVMLLGRDGC